jgi:molybdopterin-biosynthesis enzyme MoeA-like protein
MAVGVFIIGDEILTGKRQDKHLPHVIGALKARGMALAWAHYLGDERPRLVEAFRRSFAGGDVVVSFGGIGATPDDHTRQAVAEALGSGLAIHPVARAEIEARFGADAYPKRILMGEFPVGAEAIPNPFNRIPGFALRDHWFLPGFPEMSWPMLDWILDTRYLHLQSAVHEVDRAILVYEAGESQLIDLMDRIVAAWPALKLFSLPHIGDSGGIGRAGRHIELGVRGAPEAVESAMTQLRDGVRAGGFPFEERGG